jgi:F-type H+-transporting ATPase subunit gamma
VIGHLAMASSEYPHPYMTVRREVKRVGIIVVSTDRGLCGGLNVNLFKATVLAMREWREKGAEVVIATIGAKGFAFFKRFGVNILGHVDHLGDKPEVVDLIGLITTMLKAYDENKIDRLYLMENEFINTMSQKPRSVQLLPLEPTGDEVLRHHWDYLYEPDSKEILDGLLMRYIESTVYRGVVENFACEMAARMVAMKSASDNATSLIDELQLAYNKARQASITQEISEIVGGAAAV